VFASADVAVLGGGIIGAAIARELAVKGVDTVLIESGSPGSGTSGRCDGNVLVQTKQDELAIELTRRSIDGYRRWQAELDFDLRLEQRGSLVFFTDDSQYDQAQQRLAWLQSAGVNAEYIDQAEVQRREPALTGALIGAIDCLDDCAVYPPAVVAGLVHDARRHGCRVLSGVHATRLLVDQRTHVRGVETRQGVITARSVVNAMGVWAPELNTEGRVPLTVQPRQGVLLVTEAAPGLVKRAVTEAVYMANRSSAGNGAESGIAFVAEPTYLGNILLGSSRRFCGNDTGVDDEIFKAIVTRASRFMPALRNLHVIRSFAGLRPWTPDNKPIIGPSAEIPGYIVATGHEGEGIGLAPVTAEMVLATVLGTQPPALLSQALKEFGPDRLTQEAQAVRVS